MNRTPQGLRVRRRGRVAAAIAVAGWMSASGAAAQNLHGAMPMADQQQRFAALLPQEAAPVPSTRIEPVIWQSIVPD
ncbi:MAG: hypothetical protein ABI629_12865, partial [bacterium]